MESIVIWAVSEEHARVRAVSYILSTDTRPRKGEADSMYFTAASRPCYY